LKNFWNDRYNEQEYVYGEHPNLFFAEQLDKLKSGTIILPCEGEGRNAVYAALKGWEVIAFDSSESGKAKAMNLAKNKHVTIEYEVEDASSIEYPPESADIVGFIYAHFPPKVRHQIHQKAINWLKPSGKIIVEAFNPNQLNHHSGGPKEVSMLYTESMILEDFKLLKVELINSIEITLSEGKYHQGEASIIRFIGTKK
jgi:ubiquinone/menaquinone biosynthesis C-methylase UbiE